MATTAERFTAFAECPSCGLWDTHRFRMPKPRPPLEELCVAVVNDYVMRHCLAAVGIRMEDKVIDESMYEVVRICRCGKEWGVAP